MRHPFALLVAALFPLACSDTTGGTNTGGAVTVDTLAAEYATAACRSLFLCPGSENTATAQAFFENPTVCADRIRTFGAAQFDDLVASIRAGRVRLDGAAARQCLDRLAASCSIDDLDTAQLCPSALTGTVAAGGGCWRNIECAAGTFCDHSGGTDPLACPGTCRAQLAPGTACTSARQCLVPANHVAVCDAATCRDGTVGATAVEGAQCGSVPNGTNAVTLIACGAGLYCANVTNSLGTCRRNLTAGAPCTRADACPSGLACVASAGTTTTTCRRVTVVNNVGGTCDMRGQTGYCNPLLGLRCNAAMTCERVGDGTANAPCQGGDFFQSCQPGLYCNSTSMTCQPKLAAGAACTGDSACASGECSGGAMGRCLERICD